MVNQELVPISVASRILGVTENTLRVWEKDEVFRKYVTFYRTKGNQRRYDINELMNYKQIMKGR